MRHLFIITLIFISASAVASPPAIIPFTGYVTKDVNKISLQLELVDGANNQILWCQKNANVGVAKRRFMVNIGQLGNGTSVCAAGDYADLELNADNIVNVFTLELFNRKTLQVRLKIDGARIVTPQALSSIPYAAYSFFAERSWDGVPAGGVIMWSGASNNIPSGWALCDGSQGTPDLRNRFIVGTGSQYNPGATGGASQVTLSESHMPRHRHAYSFQYDDTYVYDGLPQQGDVAHPSGDGSGRRENIRRTINGQTNYTGSGNAHENRPPYYALAFIMKL